MKRLFIGVPIKCKNAENIVNNWQSNQKFNINRLFWTKPFNWHITLVFLGAYPETEIHHLIPIIDKAFNNSKAFNSQLIGVGVFPDNRKPKVLWLGLQSIQVLNKSYELLVDLLKKNNFLFDQKPLKPHLTLARIKYLSDRASLNELIDEYRSFDFGDVSVDRVILYESISTTNGVMYIPLHEKNLEIIA